MNIYSAKFMNEASASLSSKVFKRSVAETYLFSTINILREMNNVINEATKQMYINISEADSKNDENKILANYFYQFRQIFDDFSNKINEMKSRMIITIENKIETWEELTKDDGYILSFDKEFTYSGYEFSKMEDPNYPKLNLYKMYQKEFDYLGQLMQDNNGIDASSTAKLKIIAAVSNNFTKSGSDKHWVKHLVEEMLDEDDDEFENSYSECIYKALRKKTDITVNKSTLYACKEKLIDYNSVIDAATTLCDNLLSEVDKVENDICSYLFRNQDNKLIIKTDTDGIINRNYRLDTYSMNQLNLFMNNKINQIRKVLNVYCIAVGIKFDTVVDYINQNIDILNIANNYCSGVIEEIPDNEKIDDVDMNIDNTDSDEIDIPDTEDDTEDNLDDSDKELISEEEPKDDETTVDDETTPEDEGEPFNGGESLDNSDDSTNDEEITKDPSLDTESYDLEESYLFESDLFEIEMMQDNVFMHQEILEALMLEEEGTANNTLTNVQKTAEKLSGWQNILQKLSNLWKKFKEIVFERVNNKIKYLKDNAKYISTKISIDVTFKYTPNMDSLKNIKIPDLTTSVISKITDEQSFIDSYFTVFKDGDGSISDRIKQKVLGKEQKGKSDALNGINIKSAYEFCTKYQESVAPIQSQINIIDKAQRVAKDVSKVQIGESSNSYMQYFTEFNEENKDNNTNNNTNQKDNNTNNNTNQKDNNTNNKEKQISIYFKVCSQVLAAEMSCYQKLFNECYGYCKWWIQKSNSNGNNSSSKTVDF